MKQKKAIKELLFPLKRNTSLICFYYFGRIKGYSDDKIVSVFITIENTRIEKEHSF